MLCLRSVIRLKPSPRLPQPKYFSSAASQHPNTHKVTVPCKSNGTITLDIHEPPSTTSTSTIFSSPNAPQLIIYLPPHSTSTHNHYNDQILIDLSHATNLPTVTINYRLTPTAPFPGPLHDILAGYDWIQRHYFPTPTTPTDTHQSTKDYEWDPYRDIYKPPRPPQSRIAVLGDGIGGTLGLSLGLTECRTGEGYGSRVIGVRTREAVVDWVFLLHGAQSVPKIGLRDESLKVAGISHSEIALREMGAAFLGEKSRPDAFDPFASPVLFFRTAGVDAAAFSSRLGLLSSPSEMALDKMDSGATGDDALQAALRAPRKYPRRFPPAAMGSCVLPLLHLSTSVSSALRGQTEEFVKIVRRAMVREMVRGGGEKLVDDVLDGDGQIERDERAEKLVQYRREAEQRVVSTEEDEDDDVMGIVKWLQAL